MHDTIQLSSDPSSEVTESPLVVERSIPDPAAAPIHRYSAAPSLSRPVYFQAPNEFRIPYNNVVRPQMLPVFFAHPPRLLPTGHGAFLPARVHPHNISQPGPAALAQHGFSHYPLPTMPDLAQPTYQPYQRMMPTSFPPDSWIPMPIFGLPPAQNSMRNPFWR